MSRRMIVALVAALMVVTMAVFGGSALALTEGQINACTKFNRELPKGASAGQGIDCASAEVEAKAGGAE